MVNRPSSWRFCCARAWLFASRRASSPIDAGAGIARLAAPAPRALEVGCLARTLDDLLPRRAPSDRNGRLVSVVFSPPRAHLMSGERNCRVRVPLPLSRAPHSHLRSRLGICCCSTTRNTKTAIQLARSRWLGLWSPATLISFISTQRGHSNGWPSARGVTSKLVRSRSRLGCDPCKLCVCV